MADDADLLHPTIKSLSGDQARAALQALIARLSDEDAVALWQLIASWYPRRMDERPADV
jgi:hypothetical protein